MTTANRSNRKASDEDITRQNSLGVSLAYIGRKFDCHQTSIALRLRSLGVPAADTRRAFMEDIIESLTPDQQEWLADQLSETFTIKDYIRKIILREHAQANP